MEKITCLMILILLISGCASSEAQPEQKVKQVQEIKSYIDSHPNASVNVVLVPQGEIISNLISIKKDCPQIAVDSYYKTTAIDLVSNETFIAWVDSTNYKFICSSTSGLGQEATTTTVETLGDSTGTVPAATGATGTTSGSTAVSGATTSTIGSTTSTIGSTTSTIGSTTTTTLAGATTTTSANATTTTTGNATTTTAAATTTTSAGTTTTAAATTTTAGATTTAAATTTTAAATTTTAAPTTTTTTPPTTTTQPSPIDLMASSVASLSQCTNMDFVINNVGSANSGAFSFSISISGGGSCSGSSGGLDANNGDEFYCTISPTPSAGAHTITATVDSGNAVAESNENNNQVTGSCTQ